MKYSDKIKELAKKYNKSEEDFLLRGDGRIEWICEHGIGHTVWFPKGSDGVHGCDSCCSKLKEKKTNEKTKYKKRQN